MRDHIERYWNELAAVAVAMPFAAMSRIADALMECHASNNTIFVVGNGGSAATASHFACDLAKGTRTPGKPAFRVVPLTDNVPLMTAWANDTDYEHIFAEQLAALVRPKDVLVAISASGNSPNILAAAKVARRSQATVIGLTGETGGWLAPLSDIAIRVPIQSIEQVEDAHLIIAHSLCVAIRERLEQDAVDVLMSPMFQAQSAAVGDGA